MAREQFFVVLHEGRWKIKHNGQHSMPYNTKAESIKSAIDQAHEAQKKGGLSSVIVENEEPRSYGSGNEDVQLSCRGSA